MTDYIKILSYDKVLAKSLIKNTLLCEYSKSSKMYNKLDKDENTTIKQSTRILCYKEILFCFFDKDNVFTKLEILIKPHYYFNNNKHNANDFSALNSIKILTEIKDIFYLPVNELKILNIEFGINGISPIDCKNLISYTLYHERNEFINSSDDLRFSKISFKHHISGKANKYKQIKFYAKGLQFIKYANKDTFRFEIKSKQRKYIKSIGVETYADLLKVETYNKFAQILKEEFNKFLILDIDNNKQNLNANEVNKLNQYLNSVYWVKALQGSRNVFSRHKSKYFDILDKTGNNIYNKMRFIINDKLKELIKGCAISTPQKELKKCAISTVYIIGNCTRKQNKTCMLTGLDISMQKANSFLLSNTGLKHIERTNKKKFDFLVNKLITGNHNKYEKNIYSKLSKQIRNRFYNNVSSTIEQLTLF